ncbi:MAG: hypothetical protein ACFCBU_04310, partial [Cyanophyceae cyanobacterium]
PVALRLVWVAQQYKEMEEWDRVAKTLDASMAATETMEDMSLKVSALLSIGRLAGKTGNGDRLLEALRAAQTQTAAVDSDQRRGSFLVVATQIYQEFPQFSQEGNRIGIALALAQTAVDQISEPWDKSNILLQLAQVYKKSGRGDRALAAVEQAELAIAASDKAQVRVFTLFPIAQGYDELGERDRAIATLEKAETAVDQLEQNSMKANALLNVAQLYANYEVSDRAAETMEAVLS